LSSTKAGLSARLSIAQLKYIHESIITQSVNRTAHDPEGRLALMATAFNDLFIERNLHRQSVVDNDPE
jgi:hypothetical protein